jgi:hypothetical protein
LRDGLFNKALSGTKAVIEHYNETVVKALDTICDAPSVSSSKKSKSGDKEENEVIPTDVKVWHVYIHFKKKDTQISYAYKLPL